VREEQGPGCVARRAPIHGPAHQVHFIWQGSALRWTLVVVLWGALGRPSSHTHGSRGEGRAVDSFNIILYCVRTKEDKHWLRTQNFHVWQQLKELLSLSDEARSRMACMQRLPGERF
jgi:hypothetical protein